MNLGTHNYYFPCRKYLKKFKNLRILLVFQLYGVICLSVWPTILWLELLILLLKLVNIFLKSIKNNNNNLYKINNLPNQGIRLRLEITPAINVSLKAIIINIFWICIFITAFPINVAPKNVQNGTKKWPQVIPAKSNNGFGI